MEKFMQSCCKGGRGRDCALWLAGGLLATACLPTAAAVTDVSSVDIQSPGAAALLEEISVTATRLPLASFDVPASIDIVGSDAIHNNRLGLNLSESLGVVPGLLARDRQNYAQDTQISIRGFGARAPFGVRGVRLYLDGIPATQPDGQGQVSHFNMDSADRVEILRGPFSALYGNSSGGVIQMFSADHLGSSAVSGGITAGSFGTWRLAAGVGSSVNAPKTIDYKLDYSRFRTDGFRDHSGARRDSFNGKINWRISETRQLSLVVNGLYAPEAEDPLGLTRVQFDENPSQATAAATQFNSRKGAAQTQAGLIYDWQLGGRQSLRVLGYFGHRNIEQYLAIPVGAQARASSSGGVIDLRTDYGGSDARWSYLGLLGTRKFSLVAGLSYDDLTQHRLGYNNYMGDQLGVRGDKRRDERNRVYDLDQYSQASYDVTELATVLIGVRHSQVRFDSDDHYIISGNGDDSGKAGYSATTPVAGLMLRADKSLHFYASYGEGFETPTFAELAYQANGGSGLNFGLVPARTHNSELGAKLRPQPNTAINIAVFEASTRDELAVATNTGGRSTFQNIDRTRRRGAEASLSADLPRQFRLRVAVTALEAIVRDSYTTCAATPCAAANVIVPAGNRIPGVPKSNASANLRWGKDVGWNASIDASFVGKVAVNDSNSEFAPSYSLFALTAGHTADFSQMRVQSFVRCDNCFDRDYMGSVIVNDGNGRFYEPGPGRSVFAGFKIDWRQ